MNDKINLQDLIDLLQKQLGSEQVDVAAFVRTFWETIEEGLLNDGIVKVKGLGTFKLVGVESRESINVNTGERIEIQQHSKITFMADTSMRNIINKPFAHFESVILNDNTTFDDIEESVVGESETNTVGENVVEEQRAEPIATGAESAVTDAEIPEPAVSSSDEESLSEVVSVDMPEREDVEPVEHKEPEISREEVNSVDSIEELLEEKVAEPQIAIEEKASEEEITSLSIEAENQETSENVVPNPKEIALEAEPANEEQLAVEDVSGPDVETGTENDVNGEDSVAKDVVEVSTPEDSHSEEMVPEESVSEEVIPEDSHSEEMVPEESVSEEVIPEDSHSEEMVPEESVSEEVIPEDSHSEEMVPEESVSEEVIPEDSHSEEMVPEESVSEEVIPEDSHSEEMVPEESVSEEVVSDDPVMGIVVNKKEDSDVQVEEEPDVEKEKNDKFRLMDVYQQSDMSGEEKTPYRPLAGRKLLFFIIIAVFVFVAIANIVSWYSVNQEERKSEKTELPSMIQQEHFHEQPSVETAPEDNVLEKEIVAERPVQVENGKNKETVKKVEVTPKQSAKVSVPSETKALVTNVKGKETLADTVEYVMVGVLAHDTIRPGTTLAKLSFKYYGNRRLWQYIAAYNKSVVKNPNNVPIGTVLSIPKLQPRK